MRLITRLSWPLRAALLRVLLAFGPRDTHEGIALRVLHPVHRAAEFFAAVKAALDVLRSTDVRFLEVAQSLRYIVLVGGGGETYLHPLRAYLVDARLLATRSPQQFASAIIHEATHAESARRGTTCEVNDPRRVEEMCVEAELEFLEHAGCPSEVLEAKRRQTALEWWSERELKKRRLEQLSAHGVPRFLRRLWGNK